MDSENSTSSSSANSCFAPEPTIVWYWSVRSIISIASIAGNGAIIFLITTKRRLKNMPNMFILSLAVADLCFGVVNGPVYLPCTFWLSCNPVVMTTLLYISLNASILNSYALTFDRYMAIVFPLWYQMIVTKHEAAGVIAASWLFAATPLIPHYTCLFSYSHKAVYISYTIVLVLIELVPAVGMVFAYFHMFKIVRGRIAKMKVQRAQVGFNHDIALHSKVKPQESSSLNVVGGVILVFILCNTISIYRVLFCLLIFPESCSSPESLAIVYRLLVVTNSAANFVIYALFKTDIRREVNSLCCCPGPGKATRQFSRYFNRKANQVNASTEMTFMALQPTNGSKVVSCFSL